MSELGFVGLGVMGGRMVKRLLDAGHRVTGYNRTRSKAQWLLDAGMGWGKSPRAVAEHAEICFSMVTNTEALRDINEGPDGLLAGLGAGKIYVDMSTVSPAFSRDLAQQAAGRARQCWTRQFRGASSRSRPAIYLSWWAATERCSKGPSRS